MRRLRGEFFGSAVASPWGPLPTDIPILAAAISGLRLWDIRYGVQLVGNLVKSWTSSAGAPMVLSPSSGNSNSPTYVVGNPNLIVFNGTNQNLANGATAISQQNVASTLFMVAEFTDASASGHNYAYLSDATAGQNGYGFASSATVINAELGIAGVFTSISSIVNVGTTIITGIVSTNGAGGAGGFSLTIPNKAAVTGAPGAGGATNVFIGCGGGLSGPNTATFAACKVRAIGFFPAAYSAGNVTTIQNWAIAHHSSVSQ